MGIKNRIGNNIEKNYPDCTIAPVEIPIGKNEGEMWKTFETIFDQINENEEVYFDITNGFRSIPILALTILNYAKVLKNIKVKGIFYGALEAKDKTTGKTPIFDLIACNNILDWTVAADTFIQYGKSEQIGELCKNNQDQEFKKVWREKLNKIVNLTNCIATSRGMEKNKITKKDTRILKRKN